MSEEKLFKQCFDLWGIDSQILMLSEESNELTQASLKMFRAVLNDEDKLGKLAEEIADTELMIDEMKWYFPNLETLVSNWREAKKVRLQKRIDDAKQRNRRESMCGLKHEFKEGCCGHSKDSDCHV